MTLHFVTNVRYWHEGELKRHVANLGTFMPVHFDDLKHAVRNYELTWVTA